MKVSKQGYGHFSVGKNNQDYFVEKDNLKMVLDGCSAGELSEVGTRLFGQFFYVLPDATNLSSFEDNVKIVFDKIIEDVKFWYKDQDSLERFITDNLLFTIIACFETEDEFVVKVFGDGYIVSVNKFDRISYLKFSCSGNRPPYFAYRYCESLKDNEFIKNFDFKTFRFSKNKFKKVGVATDGIAPIPKGEIDMDFDKSIAFPKESMYKPEGIILANFAKFNDDITIVI